MISFGLLFLIIPLTAFTAFLISKSSAKPWVPPPPSRLWIGIRTGIKTIRSLIWCMTAPAGIMVIFIVLGGGQIEPGFFRSQFLNHPAPIVTAVHTTLDPPFRRLSDTQRTNHVVPVVVPPKSVPAPTPSFDQACPPWTVDQDKTIGDVRRIVLSSQLWSTEDEAAKELQSKVASLIRSDFDQRHPGPFNSAGPFFMTDEQLANVAVKQRYVEHAELDFGKFSSPMNRLWWQVEISPLVRTEIYPAWKASVVRQRVFALGTVLALLTFAANVVGLATTFTRPSGSMGTPSDA